MSFRLQVQRVIAFVTILVVTTSCAPLAIAQYTWNQDSDGSGNWIDPDRWSGNEPTGFPNAVGATALITAPTTTAPLVGNTQVYNLTLPAADVTVGSLTIDNTSYANTGRSNFTNGGNNFRLIFEDTDGTATYTETAGSAAGATNSQYRFRGKIRSNSNLIIDQDNYPNLNTGTIFENLIEGAADKTITKNGHGGIQLEYNHLGSETPFQGNVVINRGGIRLLTPNPLSNVSGITVNAGGQLMLADNANNNSNTDWSFGSLSNPIILNGPGKAIAAGSVSTINPEGALRITVALITSTNVNNPVLLQSDSTISVPTAGITGTLTSAVTGGGLTKHGLGNLILNNPDYDGDTTVLAAGGTLRIDTATLSSASDLHLDGDGLSPATAKGVLNLNFIGSNDVHSLFFDGEAQTPGIYNAANSDGWITGTGSLNVLSLPGTPGDHNGDDVVDILDYVVWRADPDNNGGDPGGYDEWAANYGDTAGSGNGANAAVPEPTTCFLVVLAVAFCTLSRRRM